MPPPDPDVHPPVLTSGVLRFLHHQHRYRNAEHAAGHLITLLCTAATVVPVHRQPGGWDCIPITTGPEPDVPVLRVADIEIETALPTRTVDPLADLDPTVHVTVWLAHVWSRFPTGRLPQLATALADLSDPTNSTVSVDGSTTSVLARQAHHLPPAIRVGIATLAQAGLLTRTSSRRDGPHGRNDPPDRAVYRLTIPSGRVSGR